MVSTYQAPFRIAKSERCEISAGCLGFGLTKFHHFIGLADLLLFRWSVKPFSLRKVHSLSAHPNHTDSVVGQGNGSRPRSLRLEASRAIERLLYYLLKLSLAYAAKVWFPPLMSHFTSSKYFYMNDG